MNESDEVHNQANTKQEKHSAVIELEGENNSTIADIL
jgi:hypothetical protein